jgi:hypothetical protein
VCLCLCLQPLCSGSQYVDGRIVPVFKKAPQHEGIWGQEVYLLSFMTEGTEESE